MITCSTASNRLSGKTHIFSPALKKTALLEKQTQPENIKPECDQKAEVWETPEKANSGR